MNSLEQYRGFACFGEHGRITHVGSKIQCHICGNAFKSLISHITRIHEIKARDYKSLFGLHSRVGLVCDDLHMRLSAQSSSGIQQRRHRAQMLHQTTCTVCGRVIETRISPKSDHYPKTCERDECKSQAKIRGLTPWRVGVPLPEQTKQKIVATKALQANLVERRCTHCGKTFMVASHVRKATCRPECRTERMRSLMNALNARRRLQAANAKPEND